MRLNNRELEDLKKGAEVDSFFQDLLFFYNKNSFLTSNQYKCFIESKERKIERFYEVQEFNKYYDFSNCKNERECQVKLKTILEEKHHWKVESFACRHEKEGWKRE